MAGEKAKDDHDEGDHQKQMDEPAGDSKKQTTAPATNENRSD
jgi:hypothetical protein